MQKIQSDLPSFLASIGVQPHTLNPCRENPETQTPVGTDTEMAHCPEHGDYPISMRDAQGVLRYRPAVCPACLAERVSQRLMEGAAIAPRHQHCRFESFIAQSADQKAVLNACREYAEHFAMNLRKTGSGLILSGQPGTGKNHLATAIAREVMAAGFSVMQTTAHEVIVRIRETWGKGNITSEREVVRVFTQADLLILDEVGKQFGGKGDEVHLFEVINQRYLALRPTLVLSNENVEGIREYLGVAAFDRICENGQLLQLNWCSYRRGRSARSGQY